MSGADMGETHAMRPAERRRVVPVKRRRAAPAEQGVAHRHGVGSHAATGREGRAAAGRTGRPHRRAAGGHGGWSTWWRGIPYTAMAAAIALLPATAPARMDKALVAGQIVTVLVYKDDRQVAQGAGVVIDGEGAVLTSAAVLDAGPRVAVAPQEAGELAAKVELKEKGSGLGVLRVDGLDLPGLPLSVAEVSPGDTVYSVIPEEAAGRDALNKGAVSTVEPRSIHGGGEVRFLHHNAMIDASGYGSPVVNECGHVVALNVPDPGAWSIFTVPHKRQPKEVVFALDANDVAPRLEGIGVALTPVTETCAAAEERERVARQERQRAEDEARQAEEARKQAERRTQEAEEKARQAQQDQEASEQEKQAARAAAEEAARKEEEAAAHADRMRQAAEEATAHAEEMQRAKEAAEQAAAEAVRRAAEARAREERLRHLATLGGAGGMLLLLLILVFWAMSARRKRRAVRLAQARAAEAERDAAQAGRNAAQAEEEAARARQRIAELPEPAPFDCLLAGTDGSGAPCALNLGRDPLGNTSGVVIGRDPSVSSHIIADPSVSRGHVRLSVEGDVLRAEDLGSTNGTSLNGRILVPGEAVRVDTGDVLEIGALAFRVDLQT